VEKAARRREDGHLVFVVEMLVEAVQCTNCQKCVHKTQEVYWYR